jgi:hypothetical protein
LLYNGRLNVSGVRSDAEAVRHVLKDLGIRWEGSLVEVDTDSHPLHRQQREAKKSSLLVVKHENNLGSIMERSASEAEAAIPKKKRLLMADLEESQLTCDVCYKVFTKLYLLKNHQLIHLGRQGSIFLFSFYCRRPFCVAFHSQKDLIFKVE